jgi:hypothetical protein
MLPPNLPVDMEWLDWNVGGAPCTDWRDLDSGADMSGCSDTSILMIWRFPAVGMLAPGESETARYRIGMGCPWPCDVPCESPVMTTASATDEGPCQGGVLVTWAPATFPGAGNGVYHVHRSTLSAADALSQPALTPAGGISAASWIDATTLAGITYYYAVIAESLDFPNCGLGAAVLGSTATASTAGAQDLADVDPPAGFVGSALRATGHTASTVDFEWTRAALPLLGEHYIVLRSDDDPQGPFLNIAETTAQVWTDPDAPPRYSPVHVWYYDVRIADECDNMAPEPSN